MTTKHHASGEDHHPWDVDAIRWQRRQHPSRYPNQDPRQKMRKEAPHKRGLPRMILHMSQMPKKNGHWGIVCRSTKMVHSVYEEGSIP